MTRKQRLLNQIHGDATDRVPMIGGWNLGVKNLATLAGINVAEYLQDPFRGVVRANQALGVDAVVMPIVPTDVHSVRSGSLQESHFENIEPEALKERADAIPDTEREALARFDPIEAEKKYREFFESHLSKLDGLEWITTLWEAPANFSLYFQYGYQAFLAATALYPEAVGRIYWEDGFLSRERNRIIVRLMKEYEVLPILFCGHDLCLNQGPMCSPSFLRKHYWPHAKTSLEPFVEAGIRIIGHCDGNVMPLVDDMIAAGFSGFQGFQYECGVDPCVLKERLVARGIAPLFFMGLSVSRTLPFGTTADVIAEVEYFLDVTDGGKGMFLFYSNVTGVEVPTKNIQAAFRHLASYDRKKPRPSASRRRQWPWQEPVISNQ
ncbi:MAG: hypothetical protein HY360_20735 [Verrucomicrobia bacterium]|nr:hypothetical protein [Verrucomicrobiota bacterium]